jgi:hypothetical protein
MSFAAIEAKFNAKSRGRDPARRATRAAQADKARQEANRKADGVVIPLSEWLGHNNGPLLPSDARYLEFCWREAAREAWRPPSHDIAVMRARKAAALGLTYREYTMEILERGRYLSISDLPLPVKD